MSITNIPLPTTIGTLQRFVRQSTDLENTGRRLQSATIGQGGINVYREGKIYIDGTLEIVTGNLVLAGGLIDGNALKNQILPDIIDLPEVNLAPVPVRGRNQWAAIVNHSIKPPQWAKKAIVYVSCLCKIEVDKFKTSKQAAVRIKTPTRTSPEVYVATAYVQDTPVVFPTVETVDGANFEVSIEFWAADMTLKTASKITSSVWVIWAR